MGIPKFLAGERLAKYVLAVMSIILLGIYLLFGKYWFYGIVLLCIGLSGLTIIKFLRERFYQRAEYIEKLSIYPGYLIGLIIFAGIGAIYVLIKGIPFSSYSMEGILYIFIPGIVWAVIGGYIQSLIYKRKN